jgi:hypothetical protein
MIDDAVFFQVKYAAKSNRGRPVGFDRSGLLVLRKANVAEENAWTLDPIPRHELVRIRVRRYWSLYRIFMGLSAALLGLAIVALLLGGGPFSYRVMLLSVPLFGFAWYALRGARAIRIDFDMMAKPLRYTSQTGCYSETLASLQPLEEWAGRQRVPCAIEFSREL